MPLLQVNTKSERQKLPGRRRDTGRGVTRDGVTALLNVVFVVT